MHRTSMSIMLKKGTLSHNLALLLRLCTNSEDVMFLACTYTMNYLYLSVKQQTNGIEGFEPSLFERCKAV